MIYGASDVSMMTLPSSERAVAAARHWVADVLVDALPATSDLAQMLTSELVANAVVHGDGDELRVRLVAHDDLLIEIWDSSHLAPHVRPHALASMSGRGLQIVDALSNEWGYRELDDGKWVWFRIDWP
jgi:anti-sigma regulatory factor (Ser/Thr protein kinase)